MDRFKANLLCFNCGGGAHIAKEEDGRCWGAVFPNRRSFICTRDDKKSETPIDTGWTHVMVECNCGRDHLNGHMQTNLAVPDTQHDNENNRKEYAELLWSESKSLFRTKGEDYLESRGIKTNSKDIRYHKGIPHMSTKNKQLHPALICKVSNEQDRLVAIQRIYLDQDGNKNQTLNPNKMTLGKVKGNAVRIGGKPRHGILGLAEGIETALSVHQMVKARIPVWACLGSVFLKSVELPKEVHTVRIYFDGDKAGKAALESARKRWADIKVVGRLAPTGKDFNDILQEMNNGSTRRTV
tara:strand:+ start:1216 stop:2106 length:891 start_codon:yes stop_codon:yes gene_type:complete